MYPTAMMILHMHKPTVIKLVQCSVMQRTFRIHQAGSNCCRYIARVHCQPLLTAPCKWSLHFDHKGHNVFVVKVLTCCPMCCLLKVNHNMQTWDIAICFETTWQVSSVKQGILFDTAREAWTGI